MIYGHDKTWHQTGHLDVETDKDGNVVSVWFRCMMLPFKQTKVDEERANSMKAASQRINIQSKLNAVDVDMEGD